MAAKRKRTVKEGDPSKDRKDLYPEGTPMDAEGNPIEGADIPVEVARKIPLDKSSARMARQHQEIMRQKAQGKGNVKWHGVDRFKFLEVKEFHPHLVVSIEQILPHEDRSIPSRPIETFATLEDVFEYTRAFWHGHTATYKWVAGDQTNPQWAQGTFSFAARQVEEEDDDMPKNRTPDYNGPPGWVQTPHGWYHPQYGYAPPPGAPPGMMGAPQPQQPPPLVPAAPPQPMPPQMMPPQPVIVQPAAAPTGVPSDAVGQLIAALAQSQAQVMELQRAAYQQPVPQAAPAPQQAQQWYQLPNGQWYHPQIGLVGNAAGAAASAAPAPAPAPAAAPVVEPPKPKSLGEELGDALKNMTTLLTMSKRLQSVVRGDEDDEPDAPAAPVVPVEDNPLKVQDVGPVRYVARRSDNAPVDATTQLLFNLDKIGDFGKSAFKEVRELLDKRAEAVAKAGRRRAPTVRRSSVSERWPSSARSSAPSSWSSSRSDPRARRLCSPVSRSSGPRRRPLPRP